MKTIIQSFSNMGHHRPLFVNFRSFQQQFDSVGFELESLELWASTLNT